MEFDLIYPERREDAFDAECIVAAVFFDDEELQLSAWIVIHWSLMMHFMTSINSKKHLNCGLLHTI